MEEKAVFQGSVQSYLFFARVIYSGIECKRAPQREPFVTRKLLEMLIFGQYSFQEPMRGLTRKSCACEPTRTRRTAADWDPRFADQSFVALPEAAIT